MKKVYSALTVTILITLASGCVNSGRSRLDIWHDIKAAELIGRQQIEQPKVRTAGINIYLLQISSDKLTKLQNIIHQTTALPIEYSSSDAFWANGFAGCGGGKNDWRKINEFLSDSQFKTEKSVSLYAVENIAEDVIVTETSQPVSILYRSEPAAIAGIGLEAGRFALRLTAKPVIGLRGVYKLDIRPVYKVGGGKTGDTGGEFVFDAAAMNVQVRPGQFILLGPASTKNLSNNMQTIGDLMFWPKKSEKVITLYLIACNLIKEPL
ncbi:MAG: hypothetical protein PHP01_07330 [Phycisphaerae bacterium]|nr:hypothetical protein [Phycisphaerae bacterium]